MGSERTPAARSGSRQAAPEKSASDAQRSHSRASAGLTPQVLGVFGAPSPAEIPLTRESVPLLQRAIGNRAVGRIIQARMQAGRPGDEPEREELEQLKAPGAPAQAKARAATTAASGPPVQRRTADDDEASESAEEGGGAVQMKRASSPSAVKSKADEEEEDEARKKQTKGGGPLQKKSAAAATPSHAQGDAGASDNRGGLPDPLRAGLEALSGQDLSGVRVHYNATEPARLNALAYTRGQDIHVGPGQEQHLPHEGWHAVQQMQGRVRTTLQAAGQPVNDDPGLEREADVMGERALQMARAPMRPPAPAGLAMARAAGFVSGHGRPGAAAAGAPVQRLTSKGVTVKDMKFAPKDIPADGAATSQASVHYSGRITAGAKINWSIVGAAHGSAIDATGKITAGAAIPAGNEKVLLKVKAEDSVVAGAHTFGLLNLWDKEFLQAKIDFPKFVGLGTLTIDPFTPGNFGKMAVAYMPKKRRLDATIRVNFVFLDDKAGAAKWNKKSKAAFEAKFISVVQNRWSQQYQFENVREPKKIWKKLNPVVVRVIVKRDAATPHQTITVHKKQVVAAVGVGGVRGQARFSASDTKPTAQFNPQTGVAEVAALAAVTPTPINFAAGKADIAAADKAKLDFMATYLRRIKNPRFRVTITGHHQQVVHPVGATAKQKAAAVKQAKQLSSQRADSVFSVLQAGRATPLHKITRKGVGDAGAAAAAAWDKADIASALPPGWQNVQTTLEHEAGHMLGVGDEYTNAAAGVGTPTSHYALTMKAFGVQYADVQAKRVADSASLMNGGNDIRPHHYVTLWDALAQMTTAAAQPTKKFVHADWQFVGQ